MMDNEDYTPELCAKDRQLIESYMEEVVATYGPDSAAFKRLLRRLTPGDRTVCLRLQFAVPVPIASPEKVKRTRRAKRSKDEFAKFMASLGTTEEELKRAV